MSNTKHPENSRRRDTAASEHRRAVKPLRHDTTEIDPAEIGAENEGSEVTVVMPVVGERPRPDVADTLRNICVEVVGGPMDGQRNRVESALFTIGRDAGNHLPLTMDPMVSSHHARIVREGRHFWLEDTGSKNGVFLGDQKLEARVLIGPGTTFTVGQTDLEFMPH